MNLRRLLGRSENYSNTTQKIIRERRGEAKQVANSKEEHYHVMKRFATEAGDEEAVRYYDEKLTDLKLLKDKLDLLADDSA